MTHNTASSPLSHNTNNIQVFHLHDVSVGSTLMWVSVFGVFQQDAVHVRAGVLEQFVGMIEDYQSNLTVTENTQFIRFLHQAKLALCEGHL